MSAVAADLPRHPPSWTVPDAPADGRVLIAALVGGLATDLALRMGPMTLAGTLAVVAVAIAFVATGRVTNPQAAALFAAAPVFGAWLVLRASESLAGLNILAIGILLALGASYARGGSLLDLTVPRAVVRAWHGAINILYGAGFLARGAISGRPGSAASIARGLALAVPLVLILGLLLASGDAVFASLIKIDIDEFLLHAVLISAGAWVMAGALRASSAPQPSFAIPAAPRLGRTETLVVLASVDLLFAAFALSRVYAMSAGGQRVLHTAGLTYAEYARSGFFELVAVAVLTFVMLLVLRSASEAGNRRTFVALSVTTVALTLAIVGSAVHRLFLYQQAFGMTTSRLYSALVCLWLAVALVMVAVWIVGSGKRMWFWAAGGAVALTILMSVNVVTPERIVVGMNADHASRTGRLDVRYLAGLGDAALPAIERALPRLPRAMAAELRTEVCAPSYGSGGEGGGWLSMNLAEGDAAKARQRICGGGMR